MLSEAKHLGSSSQDKLREESLLLISKYCEMLRGVYPERGMKGILRCAQNDNQRRACPEQSEGAQHDISTRFSSACWKANTASAEIFRQSGPNGKHPKL